MAQQDQTFLDKLAKSNESITPWQLFTIEDNPQNHLTRAKNYSRKFILKEERKFNYKNKKIKIGYFTPDFFEHAGMMNMIGIFQNHNKDEFEISAFDYGPLRNDTMHKNVKKCSANQKKRTSDKILTTKYENSKKMPKCKNSDWKYTNSDQKCKKSEPKCKKFSLKKHQTQ